MTVPVIVPWHETVGRADLKAWIAARYQQSGHQVIYAQADPWSKARAVNWTVLESDSPVVVVADADSFVGRLALAQAVRLVQSGAAWVCPFLDVYRLSRDTTAEVLAGPTTIDPYPLLRSELDPTRPTYRGTPGGGIVVVARDVWLETGGFDPKFVGWGHEDGTLGLVLAAHKGPCARLAGPLWHLYHPPARRNTADTRANYRLWRRYRRARGLDQLRHIRAETILTTGR